MLSSRIGGKSKRSGELLAQKLQKEAREKKEALAEAKRRSEGVAENSKVVFGSSTGMIARLKKKKKKRKEDERKKKRI